MVSEETKIRVIERVKELEEENKTLESELEKVKKENEELLDESADDCYQIEKYRTNYLFQKKINSNVRKFLISGSLLFAVTFFTLGYLVGTKQETNYTTKTPQTIENKTTEVKNESVEIKHKTEIEEMLDKAFEKYK